MKKETTEDDARKITNMIVNMIKRAYPEEDPEDYEDYWEFKKDNYWTKETESANRSAKQGLRALKLISVSITLILINALVTAIRG